MATFFSFFKQHPFPRHTSVKNIIAKPLSWYGLMLSILIATTLISLYLLILSINSHFLVSVPARGGTITEGMVGAPKYLNPILATTETDTALTRLIYSGLMKKMADGTIVPDLAKSYTLSPDGLTYTFTLHEKLAWSDGKALTSGDVAFTISKLADPTLYPDTYWQYVLVTTPDTQTVVITLPNKTSDFLSYATMGILPSHVWSDVTNDAFDTAVQNLQPVGSGPFAFVTLKNKSGVPQEVVLKRNKHYSGTPAYIKRYTVRFFANQQDLLAAINAGTIDMTIAAQPGTAAVIQNTDYYLQKIKTTTTVGLFHLKSDTLLSNPQLLSILDQLIDKNQIIATVENGYGILSSTPDRTSLTSDDETFGALKALGYSYREGILEKNGSPIGFSIAVENDPVLLSAARTVASKLGKFGIIVTIKAYDRGTFQEGIRNGQYQIFFDAVRTGSIPNSYTTALELYTRAYPFIRTNTVHIPIPEYLDSPNDFYREAQNWYTKTNKLWTFIHRTQSFTY